MTEIEKIEYAKTFMEKLANGINPIDDTPVKDDDIVNNVRLSRCFFYVSDILRQVVEQGGVEKKKRKPKEKAVKIPFSLTLEQIDNFQYSEQPVTLTVLAETIYKAAGNEHMEKFTYRHIAEWLCDAGLLQVYTLQSGRNVKRPTPQGTELGIIVETKAGQYGDYQLVVYNVTAQRFIVDNVDAITAFNQNKNEAEKS